MAKIIDIGEYKKAKETGQPMPQPQTENLTTMDVFLNIFMKDSPEGLKDLLREKNNV